MLIRCGLLTNKKIGLVQDSKKGNYLILLSYSFSCLLK